MSGMPAAGCTLWAPNHMLVQVATVTVGDALSAGRWQWPNLHPDRDRERSGRKHDDDHSDLHPCHTIRGSERERGLCPRDPQRS